MGRNIKNFIANDVGAGDLRQPEKYNRKFKMRVAEDVDPYEEYKLNIKNIGMNSRDICI